MRLLLIYILIVGCQYERFPSHDFCVVIESDDKVLQGWAPEIKVSITNHSDNTANLVRSLDGSIYQDRYPHTSFEIFGPDGKRLLDSFGRCGVTSPLRQEDIIEVRSGEQFQPFLEHQNGLPWVCQDRMYREIFNSKGLYCLRFYYSTMAPSNKDFLGIERYGVNSKNDWIRMIEKMSLKSNTLVIEVI